MTRAQRYLTMLRRRPDNLDTYYYTAFYLISSDDMLSEQFYKYISHEGIDFSSMLQECTGIDDRQRKILSIAHNLFNNINPCDVTPNEIANIGYPYVNDVCDAMLIASGQALPQIIVNDSGEQILSLDKSKGDQLEKYYNAFFNMANTSYDDDVDMEQ